MAKVKQLINDNGNPAANQFVITSGDRTFFQSYNSVVAMVKDRVLYVTDKWDFSNTTRKHFYIFVREYYKYGYGNRKAILNGIHDGTIKKVSEELLSY